MVWFGHNSRGTYSLLTVSQMVENSRRRRTVFDPRVKMFFKQINSGSDHAEIGSYNGGDGVRFVAGTSWSERFDVAHRLGWKEVAEEILRRWEAEVELKLAIDDLKAFLGM